MRKRIELYKGKVIIWFIDEEYVQGCGYIRHGYFHEKNGKPDFDKRIMSVTGATGVIDKSPVLMGWTAKCIGLYLMKEWDVEKIKTEGEKIQLIETAKKEYRKISKEAANIGSIIHQWVSDWILGKKPEMPDNEKVVNGITAFLKFQKERKLKWIESEKMVYSKKYNYVGTLDAIAIEGKDLTLVDFKSSNGIYSEMPIQISGYQIAYEEETGEKIDKRMIARFGKETGEFEIKELDNDIADKKAFLNCLGLKRRLKELESKK